ncbi:MAG: SDR family oxidoreductase [Rhodobiaceae bacterium]|nr:SDR family oxidoreductase [Rhodobiaceae bacterium]
MRIAITGAYGFIGEHVARACLAAGHEVIGFGRNLDLGRKRLPKVEWRYCDFNRDHDTDLWSERLATCDALINCVGLLQGSFWNSPTAVHETGTIALFDGAAQAGVKKIIHLSALGADNDVNTTYAASKTCADDYLASMDIEWVTLKPSLVYARNCYGGTALLRGLSALPGIVPLVGGGRHLFQPIAMDDLTRGIVALLKAPSLPRSVLSVTGPKSLSLAEITQLYRNWLGLSPAYILPVPGWLVAPLLWAGDLATYLGRSTAFTTTSLRQMERPNVADGGAFTEASGVVPVAMGDGLAAAPSTVGDKLHARTYWPLAGLRIVLALFWVATGVVTLTSSTPASDALAQAVVSHGPSFIQAGVLTGAFAVLDIILGLWLLFARRLAWVCSVQIALSGGYLVALSFLAPDMWLDPLGPLMKTVPVIAATLVLVATQEDR